MELELLLLMVAERWGVLKYAERWLGSGTTGEASTDDDSADVVGEYMVCGVCEGSELLLDRSDDEEEDEEVGGWMSGEL